LNGATPWKIVKGGFRFFPDAESRKYAKVKKTALEKYDGKSKRRKIFPQFTGFTKFNALFEMNGLQRRLGEG